MITRPPSIRSVPTPVNSKPGMVLVLSGLSGVGKSTLATRLLEEGPGTARSISCTTRAPRGQEVDGVDYHFLTRGEFLQRVRNRGFVEWAVIHGNFYGTPRDALESSRHEGGTTLIDADVKGGKQIKKQYPEAVLALVVPPSSAVLEQQLRGRGTDTPEVVARRLAAASRVIEEGRKFYDYVIVNDDLTQASRELRDIVTAEAARRQPEASDVDETDL